TGSQRSGKPRRHWTASSPPTKRRKPTTAAPTGPACTGSSDTTFPTRVGADVTDVRNAVEDELKRLEEDILYTEKGHFSASNEHGRIHLALGLLATITSAVAAT